MSQVLYQFDSEKPSDATSLLKHYLEALDPKKLKIFLVILSIFERLCFNSVRIN